MAASRALRRLLHIRHLQEEQSRAELESALGELRRLEAAFRASVLREREGRAQIARTAASVEPADRAAALEEAGSASLHAATVQPQVAGAREEVNDLRAEFLGRRVERRQAETLIAEAEAREALDTARRDQQALDDRYVSRRQPREGSVRGAEPEKK